MSRIIKAGFLITILVFFSPNQAMQQNNQTAVDFCDLSCALYKNIAIPAIALVSCTCCYYFARMSSSIACCRCHKCFYNREDQEEIIEEDIENKNLNKEKEAVALSLLDINPKE